jgi:hypothetical protein
MRRKTGWRRKTAIATSMAVVFGGAVIASIGVGHADERCGGLDSALRSNLNFIADQRAHPDALSAARIANRQDVVRLIQRQRHDASCTAKIKLGTALAAAAPATPAAAAPATTAPPSSAPASAVAPAATNTAAPADQVCVGSTVTRDGSAGTPSATSGNFPVGTLLKVTNLDNNLSITVPVVGPSGSCVLLNDTAFNQIHEPAKNLIRRALIERVG